MAKEQQLTNSIQALNEQAAIFGSVAPDKRVRRYQEKLAKLREKPPMSLDQFKQQMAGTFHEIADLLPD